MLLPARGDAAAKPPTAIRRAIVSFTTTGSTLRKFARQTFLLTAKRIPTRRLCAPIPRTENSVSIFFRRTARGTRFCPPKRSAPTARTARQSPCPTPTPIRSACATTSTYSSGPTRSLLRRWHLRPISIRFRRTCIPTVRRPTGAAPPPRADKASPSPSRRARIFRPRSKRAASAPRAFSNWRAKR